MTEREEETLVEHNVMWGESITWKVKMTAALISESH